jgi:hypothetical protein
MRFVWLKMSGLGFEPGGIESADASVEAGGKPKTGKSFEDYRKAFESLDPKEKEAFFKLSGQLDKEFTGHSIQRIRDGGLSGADANADSNPDRKYILLSSAYLQTVKGKPNVFKADFKGNYLAEYKAIGWGHVFPWTADEIKVANEKGEVICSKAIRGINPADGREGYYEAEGMEMKPPEYRYVYMYSGFTAEILKTLTPEEAALKRDKAIKENTSLLRSKRTRYEFGGMAFTGKSRSDMIEENLGALSGQAETLSSPLESAEAREGRGRIVSIARSFVGSHRFDADFKSNEALRDGNLGCAWVASTILQEAGYLDHTIAGVDGVQSELIGKGWRITTEQPEPGDVVIYGRLPGKKVLYDDGSEAWRSGHKHIGIVVGSNTVVDNRGPKGPQMGSLFRPGRGIDVILKPPGSAKTTALQDLGEAPSKKPARTKAGSQAANPEAGPEKADTTVGLKGIALIENPQFREKLNRVAENIGCSPEDLIAIFTFESNGINPQEQNSIGATGLIQWIPSTARGMFGMDVNQIRGMSGLQQLSLVEEYFKRSGRNRNIDDLYLSVLYPYAKNKPDDYILGSQKGMAEAQKFADNNPFAGKDKNGRARLVRKSDVLQKIRGVRDSNKYIARYQQIEKPGDQAMA